MDTMDNDQRCFTWWLSPFHWQSQFCDLKWILMFFSTDHIFDWSFFTGFLLMFCLHSKPEGENWRAANWPSWAGMITWEWLSWLPRSYDHGHDDKDHDNLDHSLHGRYNHMTIIMKMKYTQIVWYWSWWWSRWSWRQKKPGWLRW